MYYQRNSLILVIGIITVLAGQQAQADFVFGTPENLGPAINSSIYEAAGYGFSDDGLSLAFIRIPPGTGRVEGWLGIRPTLDSPWEAQYTEPVYDMERAFINSVVRVCFTELMSPDGLEAYFGSTRAGGYGGYDIWMMTRKTTDGDWGQPVNLGPTVNSVHNDWSPVLSPDGLELYFCDFVDDDHAPRPGGSGSVDLWVTKRVSMDAPWTEPVNLGPAVNSSSWDSAPYLSRDGLLLFFDSRRPGGYGSFDLYMTRRKSLSDPWEEAINLGPVVNTPGLDESPQLSGDGSTLYWGSNRSGGYGDADIWQVSITPTVDLNGEGIVDAADMCIMVDNWGTDNSLCDIGPTPFGDGIVDVQDLLILTEHLTKADVEADIIAIEEVLNQYAVAVSTGDLDLFISIHTDDAVNMGPDAPATFGKEELRASLEPLFNNFTLEMTLYPEEAQADGDLGFARGTYTLSTTPKNGGEPGFTDGKYLTVCKRQADGSWKISRECYNSNVPPAQ